MAPLVLLDCVPKTRLRSAPRTKCVDCRTPTGNSGRVVIASVARSIWCSGTGLVGVVPETVLVNRALPFAPIARLNEPVSLVARVYGRLVTAPVARFTL